MQNSRGAGTIVLKTPTFATADGQNTTRPSGIKLHPKNLAVSGETGAQFEYVKLTGSIIPTFDASAGQHITFPEGSNAPPLK